MRLVIIESPYTGDIETNTRYARLAMLDSLKRGEAPFVSHLLYIQVLEPKQQEAGMQCGWAWIPKADLQAVYTDLGISPEMILGIDEAVKHGIPTEYRSLRGTVGTCRQL